jgi:hypothetical protein
MKKTTTVIFSKNRSLQLDLLLRTLLFCCEDILKLSDINVLYTASDNHKESYEILKKEYPQVNFVEEIKFKDDFLKLLDNKTNILFLCDDSVFTEKFSLEAVLKALESDDSYVGFSLRLGRNTKKCYPYNDAPQEVPDMEKVDGFDKIEVYQWKLGQLDFGYPLEVSSSIYKIDTIKEFLVDCDYHNPNEMEARLVENVDNLAIDKPLILCFDKSACFSSPVNRVQTYNSNRCGDVDSEQLLEYFMDGTRIDCSKFHGFVNGGAHEVVDFVMVDKYEQK